MTLLARLWTFVACVCSVTVSAAAPKVDPLDWPMWRGPEQNGVSREKNLIDAWDPDGTNVVWKNTNLGTRSTPIIMNGKLYALAPYDMHKPDEGERVVCADALTGKILWENKFNVFLSDVPRERVAWSAVVGDPSTGHVYAMGVCGYFQGIDGETGKTLWSRSLNEEFGLLSTYGGRTNVPVVFEDLVITSAVMTNWGENSIPAHRFLAMNKMTGETVWFNGTNLRPEETTYSTPVLTYFKGQASMVFGSGDGRLWAMQPRTGRAIWNYNLSQRCVNIPPSILPDGRVFIAQSEENPDDSSMGQIVCIDGNSAVGGLDITKTGALWKKKEIMIGRAGMVAYNDRIYGADDSGNVYTFDIATGAPIGKRVKLSGTIMRASLLYADDKIYACTTNTWHILKPDEKAGTKVIHRLRLPQEEEVHGSPIVSHGKLYFTTTEAMYCLAAPDAAPSSNPQPAPVVEATLTDKTPAWVQITPVESIIKPGESVKLTLHQYNALGQRLGEVAGTDWTVEIESGKPAPPGTKPEMIAGPGTINSDGTYTAASDSQHSGVIIKTKAGELVGRARIRVVPPLPWKWDFTNKQVPVTWNGMRYRHIVREVDGEPVMVKVTTIPKGTKSQGWFGMDDLSNYTIQADMRGAFKNNFLPDMGVIAQRYTLDVMGQSQQLQIRSWASQLDRFSKSVPFTWKQDVWYTIKFRASVKDGAALLQGKVWERGTTEPEAWSIEATDPAPNVVGSPGLFGNANNAEIFIDNVTVTPN